MPESRFERSTSASARRIRVLIVEPAGLLWGSERALLDLLRAVDTTRFDITVALPQGSELEPLLAQLGVRTVTAPLASLHLRGRPARVWAMLAMLRVIAKVRPHVIHLNQCGVVRVVGFGARILRRPVVTHVRIDEDVELLRNRVPALLLPRAAIAISRDIESRLVGSPLTEVTRIYDPYFPIEPGADRAAVRASLGIPMDAPLVCTPARIGKSKRQDIIVRALHLSRDRSMRLLIVGGDAPDNTSGSSYGQTLRSLVTQLGLDGRVVFSGMRADVLDLIAASDAVVLASDNEPFGRVLLEALCLDVPIIAADAGGPREIIGADERGYLFDPGDAASLEAAITRALGDGDEATRRTSAGKDWVLRNCSPSAHARSVEQIYSRLSS